MKTIIDLELLKSVRKGAYENLKNDFFYSQPVWYDEDDDEPAWEGEEVLLAFQTVLDEVAMALGLTLPAQD